MSYTFYILPTKRVAPKWGGVTAPLASAGLLIQSNRSEDTVMTREFSSSLRIAELDATVMVGDARRYGFNAQDWVEDFGRNLTESEIAGLVSALQDIELSVSVSFGRVPTESMYIAVALIAAVARCFHAMVTVTETWFLPGIPTGIYKPEELLRAFPAPRS